MTACWLNKALFKDATWAFKLRLTLKGTVCTQIVVILAREPPDGALREAEEAVAITYQRTHTFCWWTK